MQLQTEDLLFKVKTVTHPLASDAKEHTRRKHLNSQKAESLATEIIERKMDENDFRQVKALDISDPLNVDSEMRTKMNAYDKNTESNEIICEAMYTSESGTNENVGSSDRSSVAAENFNLSNEIHGPESLPNYGESSHSTITDVNQRKRINIK
ncbi:hypothetical protein AVEN_34990-1 [Araneus ventricosus]|uniref:Uncharacterized protein n=1 Tax=Araneus ventricosus TaxID=182803 RepID=A0A4Y2DCQ8_ARAVE|nr:hypothetical protein AVEN_34990-1 [Araneus ventricosus]